MLKNDKAELSNSDWLVLFLMWLSMIILGVYP